MRFQPQFSPTRYAEEPILVHRQPILSQWKERISSFLGIPQKEIGVWGGAKGKVSGKVDIAMLQTLARKEEVEEIVYSGEAGHRFRLIPGSHRSVATLVV